MTATAPMAARNISGRLALPMLKLLALGNCAQKLFGMVAHVGSERLAVVAVKTIHCGRLGRQFC
jgi:hypothetical protein